MNKTLSNFFLIVILLYGCNSVQSEEKCKEWKVTNGYVRGNSKNRYIFHSVNGREYKNRFLLSFYGEVDDELFELKYCKSNPKNIEINYCKPIFLEKERTEIFKGKIKKIVKYNIFPSKYSIQYSCVVQGKIIEKEQELPSDYKKRFPNLSEGQFFEVECLLSNARRNLIHLDRQIK